MNPCVSEFRDLLIVRIQHHGAFQNSISICRRLLVVFLLKLICVFFYHIFHTSWTRIICNFDNLIVELILFQRNKNSTFFLNLTPLLSKWMALTFELIRWMLEEKKKLYRAITIFISCWNKSVLFYFECVFLKVSIFNLFYDGSSTIRVEPTCDP